MDTALGWVTHNREEAPAYVLVDEGYDVWLGNQRGNRFSRKHTTLDPDSDKVGDKDFKAFFDFSWKEIGDYDAPAFI